MEILRFDNAGSTAPQRKKSSKGMLAVGLVATLFGISSAFASSTITINSDAPISLGQGVSKVTGCDENVTVSPHTAMVVETTTPTFFLDYIAISDVDTRTAGADGVGCNGKTFDIQVFHNSGSTVAYDCTALNHLTSFDVSYTDGTAKTTTGSCASSTVSFTIPTMAGASNPTFTIPFTRAPSDISYITLVSRN